MVQRCHTPHASSYERYGGRGIMVCEAWRASFETFYRDMGSRPSAQHTIERMDNNGPYAPWNCRWATYTEQNNNHRRNRRITYGDSTLTVSQWARRVGINRDALTARLNNGWSVEHALTRPPQKGKRYTP
jgi:hypothetical protein